MIRDPDGTQIVLIEAPVHRRQLSGITLNCGDLDATEEWDREFLGFRPIGRRADGPIDGASLGLLGPMAMKVQALGLPKSRGFLMALEHWIEPAAVGTSYTDANHLGVFRLALRVKNLDLLHDKFLSAGVDVLVPPGP